jgi:ABC-type sulfate transport system substrate-binding protein
MALAETLQAFVRRYPAVDDIFYLTTPPSVLLRLLETGGLCVGNLRFSVAPHVMLSPPPILDRAVAAGRMRTHRPFMRSLGNVLLVRKGNPKSIRTIADLARPDVKLFLSNPLNETASYQVYTDSLKALAGRAGQALDFLSDPAEHSVRVVHGERIHHREAPQTLADGRADAAFLYYHLALRYTRIFPDWFEIVLVDDTPAAPAAENVISHFHAGLVDGGGEWGGQMLDFLFSEEVEKIYRHHGLHRP